MQTLSDCLCVSQDMRLLQWQPPLLVGMVTLVAMVRKPNNHFLDSSHSLPFLRHCFLSHFPLFRASLSLSLFSLSLFTHSSEQAPLRTTYTLKTLLLRAKATPAPTCVRLTCVAQNSTVTGTTPQSRAPAARNTALTPSS